MNRLAWFDGRIQGQIQPCQTDIAVHVAGAVAARRVIKNRKPVADLDYRRETDALSAPAAIRAIQHHGFFVRIPMVQIFRPINPNGVGALMDMVAEQKPRLVGRFKIEA